MKTKSTLILLVSIIIAVSFVLSAQSKEKKNSTTKSKVTFIELGSVNCIPCKMMQPVMKNIEKKYGEQVKVIFYDVWTQEQRQYAEQYKIRVIPTQVFLDENGKEFHRHEGFYPEEEIAKLLKSRGLKPKNKGD
ncbi:MAG: thioredoxin [Ignavibacteria bacterium RIFOXYB2_FULL_35_12]|nr:MAG: thioredoxin [Ignavibacteria bacterium GWA2_36_19]OGU51402.1 MAG: thioredoxin [Ignavibacteria bacterium GWC2_35_8]OGU59127.1 MAG: thioredoxin [Ignavibacteria bacterium GWF2_35_20]OGU82026.1 MAG: thioredoxin [Ignavibacteria bacterium RIFOXYA2_FULL_35_9]OGU88607.1 MAG: thioredoxin [Ignavibacteria bacterium RIFOXYA12_FULL_35_25]OGU89956.1 MAG: thioredoxin [Ignavibacteria bacterium RIFOXYC12_FULL_35_11]OGU94738.1 MAG: thioredoxin [Ignavibacteria bacterium RIFOXYB12_FULL_35_14]OGV00415.1 M